MAQTRREYFLQLAQQKLSGKLRRIVKRGVPKRDLFCGLLKASQHGRGEVAKLLIEAKAHPGYIAETGNRNNKKYTLQCTPLALSALYGKPDCLQVLLEAKADVNQQNNMQETALMWAAAGGRPLRSAATLPSDRAN
eukprot:jgi/Bigna1/137164/aug1.37_g11872